MPAVGGIALALAMLGGFANAWRSPSSGWKARLFGGAFSLVVVSAAATLATWPLVAANFGEVALLGVPISVLAIPAMAPAVVATIAAAGSGLAFEPLGQLVGWIAVAPLAYLIAIVSALPVWTVESAWTGRPLLLAWYGALGLGLLAAQPHQTRRWRKAVSSLPTAGEVIAAERPNERRRRAERRAGRNRCSGHTIAWASLYDRGCRCAMRRRCDPVGEGNGWV